ncbi:WD40 repeat-like protein [Serendipita vermifera]|nr:WD40 repeat-like protein [Serendipita vermifera]
MKISLLQHAAPLPTPSAPAPVQRNTDPLAHPLARARERKRALNASKMERMFSKPFIAAFEGHEDSVCCLERIRGRLGCIASAGFDGRIVIYSLSRRSQLQTIYGAHKGKVAGICMAQGDRLLSAGHDRTVKLWELSLPRTDDGEDSDDIEAGSFIRGRGKLDVDVEMSTPEQPGKPLLTYPGKTSFNSIHHHRHLPQFATASNGVHIWDETKTTPISDLTFGGSNETVESVRFNLAETSVLASIGSDRTLCLYDVRTGKAERRVVMQMRSNALSWSPTQPSVVLLASEDHNLYTFDIRSLNTPTQIYKGHVSAVISCDWSPTGTEFVSGGWDRTVRIWKEGDGHGREGQVYHGKRMQRVMSTMYTSDARFVLSASDDGNVRLWKSHANERLGVLDTRERNAIEYRDALKQRWKFDEEVGKILRSRPVPKAIKSANQLKRTMLDAAAEKEDRRRKHSRKGETNPKPEKRKLIVTVAE